MRVNVLLFGPCAAAAGCSTLPVECAEPCTAERLKLAMNVATPALIKLLPSCRIAVNGAFADPSHPITSADEVALIGLVSGG